MAREITVYDATLAINVIQKPGEAVIIYRQILRDHKHLKISYPARFLHCLLRALETTPGWKITVSGLCTEMGVTRPSMIKYMNELRKAELIETELVYREGTRIVEGYLWTIWPLPKPWCAKRGIE